MSNVQQPGATLPPALAAIAAGRDNITLAEFARAMNKAEQTIRKNICLRGECYGIVPHKVGNGWQFNVYETARLVIEGE